MDYPSYIKVQVAGLIGFSKTAHVQRIQLYIKLGRGLADSHWGMGGTLDTNECHLFDRQTPKLCKICH